jgi:glycosyltransferase involved in cell wall biosynthesis
MTGQDAGAADLSVLLTIHREATLLRRTLLALAATAGHAAAAGYRLELVAALDRSDAATRAVLAGADLGVFAARQVLELDCGAPGLSRNAALEAATGRLVAFADADDLVAPDFLACTIAAADRHGPRTLVVPQWLIAFGAEEHAVEFLPLQEVGARSLFGAHPFIHRICGHRLALRGRRFARTGGGTGHGFEDWHFNAEAVADGFDLRPAPGAVMFYRRRGAGRMAAELRARVEMPPCRLFAPEIFAALPPGPEARAATDADPSPRRARLLALPGLEDAMLAVNAIDPELDVTLPRRALVVDNRDWLQPRLDAAYGELAEVIGRRRFSEVFLLPFISTGGADRYVEDIMRAMYATDPGRPILALLGEPLAAGSDLTRVPPHAAVIDLAGDFRHLTPLDWDVLTLRLIQSAAPGARIHMRPSPYVDRFMARCGPALKGHPMVFYRFGEPARLDGGRVFAMPYGFHFVSKHLPRLTTIVADNAGVVANDHRRLGLWPERWQVLLSRMAPATTEEALAARLARGTGRVLWASRPDAEKRPELLRPLAAALRRVDPGLRIEAYGNAVLGGFDTASLSGLRNLAFHGAHAGFETLDHAAFDAFLYTSWFDGLPIVLLEAAAHGLPIIAPDVGGVGGFVEDGETGLLLPSLPDPEAMAELYAAAIARLCGDPALRIRLARGALRRLGDRHSPAAHTAAVSRIFGLGGMA